MGGRTTLLTAALVLGALALAGTSVAGRSGNTATTGKLTKRPVRGIVEAVQAGSELRARVSISLHGLEPDNRYLVVQSRRGCARSSGGDQDGDTDGNDFLLWRVTARTAGDDLLGRTRVQIRTPLSTARTLKVFDVSNPRRPVRKACTLIDVWEHA